MQTILIIVLQNIEHIYIQTVNNYAQYYRLLYVNDINLLNNIFTDRHHLTVNYQTKFITVTNRINHIIFRTLFKLSLSNERLLR